MRPLIMENGINRVCLAYSGLLAHGLVNFVPPVDYLFCLNLHATFSQPRTNKYVLLSESYCFRPSRRRSPASRATRRSCPSGTSSRGARRCARAPRCSPSRPGPPTSASSCTPADPQVGCRVVQLDLNLKWHLYLYRKAPKALQLGSFVG